MIADELRRQADVFTDLVELQSKLCRDPLLREANQHTAHHVERRVSSGGAHAPGEPRTQTRKSR
jgi:hypothetical protein